MRLSRSLIVFPAIVMFLSSCSGKDEGSTVEDIQSLFRDASQIQFSAGIEADYGDRVYGYAVDYSGGPSAGTLTIQKPETVAGVTVRLSGGTAQLSFDGAQVYTGEILPGGLSPVDAVPVLLDAFANGLVTQTVGEDLEGVRCLAAIFSIDDRVDARAWFAIDTSLPLRAELSLDGVRVISCDFYNMKVE